MLWEDLSAQQRLKQVQRWVLEVLIDNHAALQLYYGLGFSNCGLRKGYYTVSGCAKDALIVWEENTQKLAPDGFVILDARRYGDTWVHILEPVGASEG